MWILIYFALLSTVSCNGVYRFNRELTESVSELRKIKGEVNYCPDDQTQCGNDQTCCKLSDGSYGCCPLPSAVCCSDNVHCCPKGTKCNLSDMTCDSVKNKVVTTLKLKVLNIKTKSICPGGESQCGNDQTCCKLSDGSYGCCPYPSAVCCSDNVHCCPKGTTCNMSDMTCDSVNNKVLTTLKLKAPAIKTKSIICPDGISQCDASGHTCCLTNSSDYVCCPDSDAVCCSDNVHCCPKGTTCNLSDLKCDPVNNKAVKTLKLKAPAIKTKSIICPGGETQCGNDQTCCKLSDDSYGCCPLPSAVCCSDNLHCCPKGTKCNLPAKTCDSINNKVVTTLKLKVAAIKTNSIICPDGTSQCGDKDTCCQLQNGSYACCPLINAVCCSDKLHCCPQNTVCNLGNGTCDGKKITKVSLLKSKIQPVQSQLTVICPGGETQCGNDQTCCKLSDDSYGCCPLPSAVCCSDNLHCCPKGTKCNLPAKTCDSVNNKVVTTPKLKAPAIKIKSIICPGGETQCGNDQTCCKSSDDSYGCCPYPSGVCCSDNLHCCPKGTKCNLPAKTCDSINNKVVTTPKLKVLGIQTKSKICPDGISQCGANGYTCCLLDTDDYGCCPNSNAVCCSDKRNCCPNDHECDLENHNCVKKSKSVNSLLKIKHVYSGKVSGKKIKITVLKMNSSICPDGQSQCDDGYTCCFNAYGSFGCCVGVNAVCCSDQVHCCPENTVCNIPNQTCDSIRNRQMFPLKSKTIKTIVKHTSCPDDSPCEEGYTCCSLVDGTYGCCSYTDAVCCSDHSHCCPSGTTCNLNTETCDNGISRLIINRPFRRP